MPQPRHTWLFEPGIWTATGRFWEKGKLEREGHGSSIVRHMTTMWEIEGTMEILAEPPARFQNVYGIPVPHAGTRIGALGVATAEFVGSEHMTYLAPDRYQARGLFLASGAIVSAWSMALVRKP